MMGRIIRNPWLEYSIVLCYRCCSLFIVLCCAILALIAVPAHLLRCLPVTGFRSRGVWGDFQPGRA